VVIYPNDHRPVPCSCDRKGCEAVFNLNCRAGPVDIRENCGFSRKEIVRIEAELTAHMTDLCRAWEDIHGIA
jgi:hypothetical protein